MHRSFPLSTSFGFKFAPKWQKSRKMNQFFSSLPQKLGFSKSHKFWRPQLLFQVVFLPKWHFPCVTKAASGPIPLKRLIRNYLELSALASTAPLTSTEPSWYSHQSVLVVISIPWANLSSWATVARCITHKTLLRHQEYVSRVLVISTDSL